MKNALILFKSENVDEKKCLDKILQIFSSSNIFFEIVIELQKSDEEIFNFELKFIKEKFQSIFVFGAENANFDVKDKLSNIENKKLEKNSNAINILKSIENITEFEINYYSLMPESSIFIPNLKCKYQGFILEEIIASYFYLPLDETSYLMIEKYVIPFLEVKNNIKSKKIVLKYCGESEKLNSVLFQAKQLPNVSFNALINENYGDFTVSLYFSNQDEHNQNNVIRFIVSQLKENIYAEEDVSLSERLFDLLKLKKLTLSTAESFTGGNIISELVKNSGASNVISEGIVCYSNESKISRLNVNLQDINTQGAVSSEVAYEMALGLLRRGKCDVAISTTGLAGPKSDDSNKKVGLNYIAIGTKLGIHTFKYEISGDRKRITETAKNNAMYLAIKILKNYNEEN